MRKSQLLVTLASVASFLWLGVQCGRVDRISEAVRAISVEFEGFEDVLGTDDLEESWVVDAFGTTIKVRTSLRPGETIPEWESRHQVRVGRLKSIRPPVEGPK